MNWMKKAVVLGVVFFLAIFFVKPIGVSTQFSVLSGIIHNAVTPGLIDEDDERLFGYQSSNAYYDRSEGKLAASIRNPWNYDFVFVLAIPLGSLLGGLILGRSHRRVDKRRLRNERISIGGYLASFLSGFLLLYGARMADGCTSGHMMSGMMQGSVSGYVFAGCAFLVAIPMAFLVGKYHRKRGQYS